MSKDDEPRDLDNQGSAMPAFILALALGAVAIGLGSVSSALNSTADGVEGVRSGLQDRFPTSEPSGQSNHDGGVVPTMQIPDSGGRVCTSSMLPNGTLADGQTTQINGINVRCICRVGGDCSIMISQ